MDVISHSFGIVSVGVIMLGVLPSETKHQIHKTMLFRESPVFPQYIWGYGFPMESSFALNLMSRV